MNVSYIFLIICLALCVFMFFYFNWYIRRRTSLKGFFQELQEQKKEASRLMADIDIVTDRNLTLAENKIKELKDLLDETDKRIGVYLKELEKSRTSETLYAQLGRGIKSALNIEPDEIQISEAAKSETKLSIVRPAVYSPPAPAPAIAPAPAPALAPAPAVAQLSEREIRTNIDSLINKGLPPEEIAKQLGISIAEVDLAMQLRR